MKNPFNIVADLESAISEYTGAPYVVAVNSCTMAILLACKWFIDLPGFVVEIPKRTYISVPMSIVHAGGWPVFRDEDWKGYYRLDPLPVWDCARYFSSDMYRLMQAPGDSSIMLCVSFHATKILGDTQGGAILLDDPDATAWLKRMRFDGRLEGVPPAMQAEAKMFTEIGYHCYMSPDVATRLLWKLQTLPKYNAPLPNDDYPDLSQLEIFKCKF